MPHGGATTTPGNNDTDCVTVAGQRYSFSRPRSHDDAPAFSSREAFPSAPDPLELTCALQFVALLVRALETVDVAVAQLGQLQELQNVRRLVHLAPEVTVFEVQEEHFSSGSAAESSE